MAKRIERSRIEAGKVELPRKLAFLNTEKVDYLAVTERDGDYTVDVPAAALSKLIKAKGELKALKSDQKKAGKAQRDAVAAEIEAHEVTKAELAKALRKVNSLTKKLDATASEPGEAPKAVEKSAAKKSSKARAPAEQMTAASEQSAVELTHTDPIAPAKVSQKNAVASALDAAAADSGDPSTLPGA